MRAYLAAAGDPGPGYTIGAIALTVAAFVGYWVPSAVAVRRKVPGAGSVVVVNAFLGWTVIGWVVALAMALRAPRAPG